MLKWTTIALIVLLPNLVVAQNGPVTIVGTITAANSGQPIDGAHITLSPQRIGTVSNEKGFFKLKTSIRKDASIRITYVGYGTIERMLVWEEGSDTLELNFQMSISPRSIPPVEITSRSTPDTVFGSFSYCVADFEFYQDKFLLLTYASRDQKECSLMLRDKKGRLIISTRVPGNATSLYKDYEDRLYVICEEQVFRINIEKALLLLVPMSTTYFEANIKPGIDMVGEKILFSDFRWNHPKFSYYTVWKNDTTIEELKTVVDNELMRMYRFEYYYLNNEQRVKAWKLADRYEGVDCHDAAVAMTGFQNSIYYEELYAPMFVVDDTVLIFDHYANKLYKYDQMNRVVDSVEIAYHQSRGAMKWRKEMVKDVGNDEIYAVFQKNGFYYLNFIDTRLGTVEGSFKMSDKYTEKMKIKDDYVYYVYDPQDKYQTPFLYKEQIRL